MIQREAKFGRLLENLEKKKLVSFESFANMTWVNLGITHWVFFIELNGVSNQSICISTDQLEGKVSNAFYIQYYIEYKYFRKLKAAGAEQSQSCLQWPCFCF